MNIHPAVLAYTEARVTGDDDGALSIASNNADAFFWQGERPEGWDDGSDYSCTDVLALARSGRIVWDDAAETYRRAAA